MSEVKNVPEIRFAEFTNAWEQRKLEECFKIRNEKNGDRYTREDVLAVSDTYGCVNQIEFHGRSFAGEDISNYKIVRKGDIIYTKSPLQAKPYGIIKIVGNETGIISPLYVVNEAVDNIDSMYMYYLFDTPERTNNYLCPLVRKGAKNTMNISNDEWLSGEVTISPDKQEQQLIGTFFRHLDNLITLHQRKHDKLAVLKKAMLEKMFPQNGSNVPEIRFAGFTDPWEQRKVGDITVESSEYANLEAGYPLLTSSRAGLMYQNEYRGNLTTNSKETLFSVVPIGACTYRHMSDDDVFHLNVNALEKGLVSREYPVFFASEGTRLDFIVQYINSSVSFRAFCAEQKKGGTRTRLYYNALCEFKMMVPSQREQDAIADFFLKLDNLITFQQRKSESLKHIKAALLQKMFV